MVSSVAFGILGCGGAALSVCGALHTSTVARIAIACDVDERLARDIGERYGVPHTTRPDEVLQRADVNAVYIAVPHDRLAPLAMQAIRAGKAALVEKPVAIRLEDLDQLTAAADERRLALGVMYQLRHAGPMIEARELVQGGAIGQVIGVRIHTAIDKPASYWQSGLAGRSHDNWRTVKARAGGGVLLMNTSHQLDLVHFITDLEVVRVSAEVGTLATPVEVEDVVAAALRYDNGAIGSVISSSCVAGAEGEAWGELYGTHGQIVLPDPWAHQPLRVFLRRAFGGLAAGRWHERPDDRRAFYTAAVDDFARAVLEGRPAPTSGEDARRVLAIVLGTYQSAHEGRAIDLSHTSRRMRC